MFKRLHNKWNNNLHASKYLNAQVYRGKHPYFRSEREMGLPLPFYSQHRLWSTLPLMGLTAHCMVISPHPVAIHITPAFLGPLFFCEQTSLNNECFPGVFTVITKIWPSLATLKIETTFSLASKLRVRIWGWLPFYSYLACFFHCLSWALPLLKSTLSTHTLLFPFCSCYL